MMKFLMIVMFVGYSILDSSERTIINNEDLISSMKDDSRTTTSWWTRTFPISEIHTVKPRSRPTIQSTTVPIRVSKSITIIIPSVLFSLTILFGFGLILFAYITDGNGIFFLTRTDAHRLR